MNGFPRAAVVLCCALGFVACGDSSGGRATADGGSDVGGGGDGGGTAIMMPGMVPSDAPLPAMMMNTGDLTNQALAACERLVAMAEQEASSRCAHNPTTMGIVDLFAELHAEAISTRPLPGRGLEAYAIAPSEVTLDGSAIEVLSCTSNPLCMGPSCTGMNAFALENIVLTLDPLLTSFAEGAAYWGQLVQAAGGDPDAVDEDVLFAGLGRIYLDQSMGRRFATVDEATVDELIENDEFVNEMWFGVTAFLILHEIGHADLGHSIVNHTAATGVQAVLAAEGRTLTPEEEAQVTTELRELKVFTETQADIYAASLLRELGFDSDGPVVLFTGAMSAFILASGQCNMARTQRELFDCAFARDPQASHPPLDVRATILRRIVDNGEDLSSLLEEITPPSGG